MIIAELSQMGHQDLVGRFFQYQNLSDSLFQKDMAKVEKQLLIQYETGKKEKETRLHALTMIDPATGWFEIAEIPTQRAVDVANILEFAWLSRYPWPTEIVMDRGKEFAAEVQNTIKHEYGITRKLITTRNPQANAIVERVHKSLHNMLRTTGIKDSGDLDPDFGWNGYLSAIR